ncbi:hypothetical protein [Vibrio coralliilyticus]|uniref:hypothetical protein n=1 Tax=Vibrio coralliilyticus TaxID=190893 RepID=UPI0017F5CE35|nr:hypothetical protein [Vibrio coralliilyticus]NUW66936.1 hypothetical protein [Vibrio coralliilyticus]
MMNDTTNNLISVEDINKLRALLREEGAKVVLNFNIEDDDIRHCLVDIQFRPVEKNDALNAIGREFSKQLEAQLPSVLKAIYAKLVRKGTLNLDGHVKSDDTPLH